MGQIAGLVYAIITLPAIAADSIDVGEADHLLATSLVSLSRGDLKEARDAAARSEQVARAHNDSLRVFRAGASLAQIEEANGQVTEATKRLLRLRVFCRERGDARAELHCLHQLAEFATRHGALEEAILFYENAKRIARDCEPSQFVATCKLLRAAYELIGDHDRAVRETQSALAACVGGEAASLKQQLLVARAMSDHTPHAVTRIQEYLQNPRLSAYVRGRLWLALGQRLLVLGRTNESIPAFESGLAILPNLNLDATRRGSFDYARALGHVGRPEDAKHVLQELKDSVPHHSELFAEVELLEAQMSGEPDLAQHALTILRQQRLHKSSRQTDFRRALAQHRDHLRAEQEQERFALVKSAADFRVRCWVLGSTGVTMGVFAFGFLHLRNRKRIAAIESRAEYDRLIERQDRFQSIGTLASGVAHDFNNIMTVVQSIVDTISRFSGHNLSSEEREMLSLILRATDSGTQITQQLVALSRGSADGDECFYAEEQVKETVGLLRRTLREQIELKVASDVPTAAIQASKAQFTTALINLCMNARDAIPGAGTITIKVQQLSFSGQDCVQISVHDDGCGMTKPEIMKASMAMYSTKSSDKGSGLGLAMVERFVTQSGGTLDISSSRGRGTTVAMRLPPIASTSTTASLSGLHVLCVDGCASVLSSVTTALGKSGCVTQAAFDPEKATTILEAGRKFDAVLVATSACQLDDGRDLVDMLHRTDPPMPVVLMAPEPTEHVNVVQLRQPFNEMELAQAVTNAVTNLADDTPARTPQLSK